MKQTSDPDLPYYCCCGVLADSFVLPMGGNGLDQLVLSSFKEEARHGGHQWWLLAFTCLVCRQHWLIAADERIYDNYYLRRITPAVMKDIVESDWWPDEFLTYEQVLELGRATGRFWRFEDSHSPALVITAEDLRRERPEISVAEIAHLLGISVPHAESLLG